MSYLRRAMAAKKALNFICREPSLYSSTSFRSIRVLGGVSIVEPPPSRPHVFSREFSGLPRRSRGNDLTPHNRRNRPPGETMELVDGCDHEHWFVVVEPPEGNPTREEIIDRYVQTLAKVVGSEEEARKKIYAVSTKHYFAFQCQISEELSEKLKPLPHVEWVLPDSWLDPRVPDYGGEPFINGQAVPYDPKYHEQWVRNTAKCKERQRRQRDKDGQQNPRNSERRREMRQNANEPSPPNSNYQGPRGPPSNSNYQGSLPNSNYQGPPPNSNYQGPPPNSTYQGPPPNSTYQAPRGPPPNSTYQAPRGPPPSSTYQAPRGPPPNSTYQDPRGPPPNSTYQAPGGPPPNSTYQDPRGPPPNSTYQAPQENTMQGAPNSTYQALQGNTMQGVPYSQGQSN